MKRSPTDFAIKRILNQLKSAGSYEIAIEMLEKSIINNWIGIFPIKEKNSAKKEKETGGRWNVENEEPKKEYLF